MSIAKRSFIDFISQIAIFFLSFVSGILVSYCLGVKGRGIWINTLAVNTILHNLSCMALEVTNSYIIGKDKTKAASVNSWSLVIIAATMIIILPIIYIFREWLRVYAFGELPALYMWIGIAVIPFSLYFAAWRGMLVGLGEIKTLSKVNVSYQFIQAWLIIYILLYMKEPLPYLIASWAVIQVLLIFILLPVYAKTLKGKAFGSLDKDVFKRMLRFCLPAHWGNFATMLMQKVDYFYINSFLGVRGQGMYSQATTFTDKISFIPQAVERGGYSKVASMSADEARGLIVQIFRTTFYIAIIASIGVYIFGYTVITLVVPKFIPALYPLKVLLPGTVFYALSRIFSMYFSGNLGKPKIPSTIAWFMLAFNGTVNYFLIKHNLMPGAAIGTTISFFVMFMINFHLFLRWSPEIKPLDFFLITKQDITRVKNISAEIRKKILGR